MDRLPSITNIILKFKRNCKIKVVKKLKVCKIIRTNKKY